MNAIQIRESNATIVNLTAYGANCIGDESRLTECLVDFNYCELGDEQATVQCIPRGK